MIGDRSESIYMHESGLIKLLWRLLQNIQGPILNMTWDFFAGKVEINNTWYLIYFAQLFILRILHCKSGTCTKGFKIDRSILSKQQF